MLCQRYILVFDKKVVENNEGYIRIKEIRNIKNVNNRYTFYERGVPRSQNQGGPRFCTSNQSSFNPTIDSQRESEGNLLIGWIKTRLNGRILRLGESLR